MTQWFEEVGNAFVNQYYNTFDAGVTERATLANLYTPDAMLTFQDEQFQGRDAIVGKLSGLGFQVSKHGFRFSAQPSVNSGVIILAYGELYVDNSEHGMPFSQVFHIVKQGAGGYFVFNDIFTLVQC